MTSNAGDSRCTWQDNQMCCTSFGRLPVSTVGRKRSVNRVLIVVRHSDLSQSQAKREQKMVLHLASSSAATCQRFLVKSMNSLMIFHSVCCKALPPLSTGCIELPYYQSDFKNTLRSCFCNYSRHVYLNILLNTTECFKCDLRDIVTFHISTFLILTNV